MSDRFGKEKKLSSFFLPFFNLESLKSKKKIFENFSKKFFLNDPTSFLNDPDLSGQYDLVIVFFLSSFQSMPKIRSILPAVFKNIDFESTRKIHFELILLNDPVIQKFAKIRHFNIFSCGFRQKFTKSPYFHNIHGFSRYWLPLFVKV